MLNFILVVQNRQVIRQKLAISFCIFFFSLFRFTQVKTQTLRELLRHREVEDRRDEGGGEEHGEEEEDGGEDQVEHRAPVVVRWLDERGARQGHRPD